MKVGDLVRYKSSDVPDDVVGIVISKTGIGETGWASVVWSSTSGSHQDDVPMSNLEVLQ